LRIVRLYKYLRERKESVIAKQMLRSGTSIGANIAESRYAQSKADFIAKLQIALKKAAERQAVQRMNLHRKSLKPQIAHGLAIG
jgi:four helix bundle protein